MNKLRRLWQDLNASLWFVPSLMVAGAILLAYLLVNIDLRIGREWVSNYPLLVGAGADGARGMLAAIAGSMMTVAGLIFSLTLSTLAQVSSQYTPRVLRNFMRNRTNQVVLGCFVSIFTYCLVVLRTIRGGDDYTFVPALSVAFGLVLALLGIGVLVFFIHHIASSIQVANIVAGVTMETEAAIDRLFPEELGDDAELAEEAHLFAQAATLAWVPVPARHNGYLQQLDHAGLLALARRLSGVIRMEVGVGSFAARGAALASVARYDGRPLPLTPELTAEINDLFMLNVQRTSDEDAGFGLRQIVDIALKALGAHDTSTAVICLDHLGALLARLAACRFPSPLRTDDETADTPVRVVVIRPGFADFTGTALNQIRTAGSGNVGVYLHLLAALATAAGPAHRPARRAVLLRHLRLTAEAAERTLATEDEKSQVRQRLLAVELLLV